MPLRFIDARELLLACLYQGVQSSSLRGSWKDQLRINVHPAASQILLEMAAEELCGENLLAQEFDEKNNGIFYSLTKYGVMHCDEQLDIPESVCSGFFAEGSRFVEKLIGQHHSAKSAELIRIPASDRMIAIDHNSSAYSATLEAIDEAAKAIQQSNQIDPETKDEVLAEVSFGKQLLERAKASLKVRAGAVIALIVGALTLVMSKFADAAVHAAADHAIKLLSSLLGLA